MSCSIVVSFRHAARLLPFFVLVTWPGWCAAEKFVPFGTQPDGSEVSVQANPPTRLTDGRRQGWFRTTPKTQRTIADEQGKQQKYGEMLALNVADCPVHRMGAAMLVYRDAKGKQVAQYELPPKSVEYVDVKPGTLGASMLDWLCAALPPAPAPPTFPGPTSPFK